MGTLNGEGENRRRKLRNIYDEAKVLLKQYLTKDSSIGNFESGFHIDLMKKKTVESVHSISITPVEGLGEEFIDISYSDLGGIVNPKNLKNGHARTSLKIQNIDVQDEIEKYHSNLNSPEAHSLPRLRRNNDTCDYDAFSTEISGAKDTSVNSTRKNSPEVTKLTSPQKKSSSSISRNVNLGDIKVEDFV